MHWIYIPNDDYGSDREYSEYRLQNATNISYKFSYDSNDLITFTPTLDYHNSTAILVNISHITTDNGIVYSLKPKNIAKNNILIDYERLGCIETIQQHL